MGHPALWTATPEGPSRVAHRVVFRVVTLFTFPFVFFATMLLSFGSDGGDRIAGVVVLVLFLPGLVALHRWPTRAADRLRTTSSARVASAS